ncbi:MAG: DUF2887 domain-containing protein [Leptolyngbyaceae cyanobacterium RU_5_1]|nr:DUF2887 domain-containing protein [Leptolyngbyaceae cyanobacterium RU_5_1]
MGILQLIGIKERDTPDRAKQLIERTREEVADAAEQRQIVELILTSNTQKNAS